MIGEKIYEVIANWRVVEYGDTPDGTRYDFHFEGKAIGKINGAVQGIDYATVDRDNNVSQHVHETITTDEDVTISVLRRGKAIPLPSGDGQYKVLGFAKYNTGSPKYSWLNSTLAAIEGTGKPTNPNLNLMAFVLKT